jgi:hypothetical protein
MTTRDRIVIMVVTVVAVLGAAWVLVVSPEKNKASKLSSQVTAAQSQLRTAEGELADAQNAQAQYAVAYASVVRLGKSVPATQEVPSLIYQLAQASNNKKVEFASIVATQGSAPTPGAPSGAGGAGASSTANAAASVTPAGFTQMPFTFVFNGTFFDLEHLFNRLDNFTVRTASGRLRVSGRLLTIQGVKLAPQTEAGSQQKAKGPVKLSGTITATAYVLPASQGLTGGATSSSPAAPGTATASTGSSSPVPTASVTP